MKLLQVVAIFFSLENVATSGSAYSAFPDKLRITSLLIEPYVMRANSSSPLRGFVVDMIDELARLLDFRYEIRLVADGEYGRRRSDGHWSGMIGQLSQNDADIAAAPMFPTAHRARVVTFSKSFMDVWATVLLSKSNAIGLKSLEDVLAMDSLRYGTLNTGLLLRSLKNSENTTIRKLWLNMKADLRELTDTNLEGIRRARQERYAFILPDTIASYVSLRVPCDLVTVDKFLAQGGYALAVQKGCPFLEQLERGLITLQNVGFLRELRQKWWTSGAECMVSSHRTMLGYSQMAIGRELRANADLASSSATSSGVRTFRSLSMLCAVFLTAVPVAVNRPSLVSCELAP